MTTDEEMRRAREAEQTYNSPMFQEFKKRVEEDLAQLRRGVSIHSTDMHTRLIEMEQIAHRFFGLFEQAIVTGKFAQVKLAEEEKRRSMRDQAIAMFSRIGRNAL